MVDNTAPNLIEEIVTRGLPYLDAESANREVIRLTIELMRLQAEFDAWKLVKGK